MTGLPEARQARQTGLLVLGETSFRDRKTRFGVLPDDRLRHLWVIGKTGTGKSTLLANMIRQDLQNDRGFALLDPHGDLVDAVLQHVPECRSRDVVLFDPEDREYPIAFNVFRQGDRQHGDTALLASELVSVFRKQWAAFWGPRLEHVLRNAILATARHPRASLLFLYRFLTDQRLRKEVTRTIEDPVVKQFWTKEFPNYSRSFRAEMLSPVLNKLGAFLSNPLVRNIVGQEESRLSVADLMDKRGILLARLPSGKIGEDASHLLGGLLLTQIQLAAMARQEATPPFYAYVDEFQNFANDSLAVMLSESRKFGLGLILAHQYLAQLPLAVRDAVLGNVGSIILFRLGAADAKQLAEAFAPEFTARDLVRSERFHAAVKLQARGSALRPFTARMLPPKRPPGGAEENARDIRERSRERYSRPKRVVEAALMAQFTEEK